MAALARRTGMTAPTLTPTGTQFVTSADGTRIAYEAVGSGPALAIVDGAMCQRSMGPSRALAKVLADSFTVYAYDRRSRGESGAGASSWHADREIEDLRAVIEAAGGTAHVFAASSGAALALDAAAAGVAIDRLVAYEAPFILDDTHAPNPADLPQQVQAMVDAGRRGEAVRAFMRVVGVPAPFIGLMRVMPAWKKMTAVAHTLPWDLSIVVPYQQGEPLADGRYAGVDVPTLVLAGGKSPQYMRNAQAAIAASVPGAHLETLDGQTHMIKAKAVSPALTDFLGYPSTARV
jgi:pimeloyl-ACP methyl ester carboxylesterase